MRLNEIEISGFRAFANPIEIDLDADVIIVTGENGQGKTSLLDAIHWALIGDISRLGKEFDPVSVYSDTGEARVELSFETNTNNLVKVIRSEIKGESRVFISIDGNNYEGSKAKLKILETFWPSALSSSDETHSFEEAFTRSVYLQQDLVRQFVDADDRQDRFNAISELIGVGRITELQVLLEKTKKAWTTTTNEKRVELNKLKTELSEKRNEISSESDEQKVSYAGLEESWINWWSNIEEMEIEVQRPESITSPSAQSDLDIAVRKINSHSRSLARKRDNLSAIIEDYNKIQLIEEGDIDSLSHNIDKINKEIEETDKNIEVLEERLDEERKKLREEREEKEELRTLAEIALRHLDSKCPVCTQKFNDNVTRNHLEKLIKDKPSKDKTREIISKIEKLDQERSHLIEQKNDVEIEIKNIQRQQKERKERRESILHELSEHNIPLRDDQNISKLVQNVIENITKEISDIKSIQARGEKLASDLSLLAEIARSKELRKEVLNLREEIKSLEKEIVERDITGNIAANILDKLRNSASDIVHSQLESIKPLLQRIFSRIDPHPTFKHLSLSSSFSYGRGRVTTSISDLENDISTEEPGVLLSSSQINSIAVSIFLAFNLGMPEVPIKTTILDDPFQSLDDINLLGLIDLLRRAASKRQMLISTHNQRFATLLERKLRPLSKDQRTIVISLEGWDRSGPRVEITDMVYDDNPFKIYEFV